MVYNHYMQTGGWRGVVLVKRGPKWTIIFEYSLLRNFKILTRDWDNPKITECVLKKHNFGGVPKLIRSIEKRRKLFKRLGMFGTTRRTEKPAKEAVKLLKEKGRCANSDPVK